MDDYHERLDYEVFLEGEGLLREPVAGKPITTLTRIVLEKEKGEQDGS